VVCWRYQQRTQRRRQQRQQQQQREIDWLIDCVNVWMVWMNMWLCLFVYINCYYCCCCYCSNGTNTNQT
jgi:hypothetical protein